MNEPPFKLWLEMEALERAGIRPAEGDVFKPDDDFCNIALTLPSGERYALNVWTFKFLERTRRTDAEATDKMRGRYLIPYCDLLVERLDRPTLEAVMADLIRTERLRPEWRSSNDSAAD